MEIGEIVTNLIKQQRLVRSWAPTVLDVSFRDYGSEAITTSSGQLDVPHFDKSKHLVACSLS